LDGTQFVLRPVLSQDNMERRGQTSVVRDRFKLGISECRGWIVRTPALYSSGSGFDRQPWHRLPWLRFLVILFSPSWLMLV